MELENQKRPHDDQKWCCSGAERKTMVRGEYRKLRADPRPRACVVSMEELPEVPGRGEDIQRTFLTGSADPGDVITASVHGENSVRRTVS